MVQRSLTNLVGVDSNLAAVTQKLEQFIQIRKEDKGTVYLNQLT